MIALGDPRIAIEASVTWGKESYDSDQTDHVKCPSENYVVDHHSKSDPNHPGPRKLMLFLVRKKQSKWASNPLNWLLLFIADVAPSNPLSVDMPGAKIASNPLFWDKDWQNFRPSNPLFLDKKWLELPGA